MGDGGVACMPLQQQKQHVMERLPNAAEKVVLCGGNSGNEFNSNLLKVRDGKKKKKVKVKVKVKVKKKVVPPAKKVVAGKDVLALDNRVSSRGGNNAESGLQMEEVEEGEMGTLKWPRSQLVNGEFAQEKPLRSWSRRSEIENGDIISERWKKGGLEKRDFASGKRRKEDAEKGSRRGEAEKR